MKTALQRANELQDMHTSYWPPLLKEWCIERFLCNCLSNSITIYAQIVEGLEHNVAPTVFDYAWFRDNYCGWWVADIQKHDKTIVKVTMNNNQLFVHATEPQPYMPTLALFLASGHILIKKVEL